MSGVGPTKETRFSKLLFILLHTLESTEIPLVVVDHCTFVNFLLVMVEFLVVVVVAAHLCIFVNFDFFLFFAYFSQMCHIPGLGGAICSQMCHIWEVTAKILISHCGPLL